MDIWINDTSHETSVGKIIESSLQDDTVAVCYPLALSRKRLEFYRVTMSREKRPAGSLY